LKGISASWPWEVTGRAAALCAAYVLENVGTQEHSFTLPEFVIRYRDAFNDGEVLNDLLMNEPSPKSPSQTI